MKKFTLVIAAGSLVAASQAAITWYSDRAMWNAAVGASSFSEDFSGFAVDTEFRTVGVAIAGGTIQAEGVDTTNFRNLVDVPPLAFTDNNGTANGSMYVNAAEGTAPGRQVRLTFSATNQAFGFETWGAASGERVTVEAYNGAALIGSFDIANNGAGIFTGYQLTGPDVATSVRWRSTNLTVGTGGEGFGMDNLAGVVVPEPASIVGLAIGAVLLLRRRTK